MANDIQLKRSSVAGKIPDSANVLIGEPVVNLTDRKMYTKNGSGDIVQIAAGNLQGLADVSNAAANPNQVLTWTGSVWAPQDPTGSSANVVLGVIVQNSFTGNGTGTTYTLTNSTSNANALIVFVDSVLQEPLTNYSISGTTLTFTSAPANGASIDVRYFAQDEFDIALGELNNVSNTTPLTGQALIWSGSQWAPANVSTTANVISVNGQTGVVTLNTGNIPESGNLYFTQARARESISVTGAGSYNNTTGVITITGGVTSVGGATGAVSNAQLASAISFASIANLTVTGNVSAAYFVGSGSGLTNVVSVITVSSTPPSSPQNGQKWIESGNLIEYTYINDGDSAQWIQLPAGAAQPSTSSTTATDDALIYSLLLSGM